MAHEKSKGWLGSLAIHGMLAGVLVVLSGFGTHQPMEEPVGALVVVLDGDGSPAPGAGDGKSTVPKGDLVPKPDETDKVLNELQVLAEKMERDRAKQDKPPPLPPEAVRPESVKPEPRKPEPAKPVVVPDKPVETKAAKPDPASARQMSLDDFRKQYSVKTPSDSNARRGNNDSGNARNNTRGKVEARRIDTLGVIGAARSGLGVADGVGQGGSPSGGGPVAASYTDRLKTLIHAQWQHLLNLEGSDLTSGMSGEFRLAIGNNGGLSFSGWIRSPRNVKFESLLLRAIAAVGNAGPRPPGMATEVVFVIVAEAR